MTKDTSAPRREMDKNYWETMARGYEKEIFSVLHSDRKGLIRKHLRRIARQGRSVADVGCGIGHFLPLLSSTFEKVYANDISPRLLERARETHGGLGNITFLAGDIIRAFRKLPRVDCAVSVNSLIASSLRIRLKMLEAVAAIVRPGGYLLLVVPSWESFLLSEFRQVEWRTREGMDPARALRTVFPPSPEADSKARQGIFPIDGVMTKHYLKEELEAALADAGFEALSFEKINYGWDTEFEAPPKWMQAPYPWDWLVTARRKGRS